MSDMNFSLTTFNKSGKLLQSSTRSIVLARKMAFGIKATNGVVIACDKKVSTTLVDLDEYRETRASRLLLGLWRWHGAGSPVSVSGNSF